MKKSGFLIGVLIWFFCFSLRGQTYQGNAINIISENILSQRIKEIDTLRVNTEAIMWSERMQEDGSWPDIDYSSKERGAWPPGSHIKRARQMAEAYMLGGDKLKQLHSKIEKAVIYWINKKPEPESDNWWFATIGLPTDIGYLLLFMQKAPQPLSAKAIDGLLVWMKKSRKIENQTSTELNRMLAIGLHYILRGCVTKDESLIKAAVKYVNQMMVPDSGYTGIQPDYSFHAHGPQLYIQGYGTTFLQRIAEFSEILSGSPYALSKLNFQDVLNYSHTTFYKVLRGKFIDYTVLGRNIARVGNLNAGHRLAPILMTYKNLDSPNQLKYYDAAIARFSDEKTADFGIEPEHLQLWSSDYSAHIRPGFYAGLRMVSTRTVKPERGNGENLLEHFRANGAMSIMVRGNEYENIFPVWKWNQIPGTTTPALKDVSGQPEWFFNKGKTDFVGGVTDGKYGVATYDMDDYDTKAKKSWFFFDRFIVCLGAGINSSNSAPVFTTINQSLSKGGIEIEHNQREQTFSNDSIWKSIRVTAVKNDEVGYYFPNSETVQVSNIYQIGSWRKINTNLSSAEVKERVFTMHIDHGLYPREASYSYSVWPGIKSIKEIQPELVKVVSNSSKTQAAYTPEKDICQVVFHEPATLSFDDIKITADKACIVLVQNLKKGSPVIFTADPTQKLKTIEVKLERGKAKYQQIWRCKLPKGKMAGSSVRVN